MHVRCLAHIVNLIVRYVRSSSARLDEFKKCVEKEKVECKKICILDIPTRWNSTFLMLDTTLEFKKAFERLYDDDERFRNYFDEDEVEIASGRRVPMKRVGPPIDTDWDNAAIFVKFLKVFYNVTFNVSASLTPTAHKAFHDVVTIEAKLEELSSIGIGPDSNEVDQVLYDMAVQMKSKYDKYFDPRYKLRNIGRVCEVWLNLPSGEIKKKSEEVKQLVLELCDLYSQSNAASSGGQKKKAASSTSDTATKKPEVKQGEEDDWKTLDWWKLNGGKYPNLQSLARDVLAIYKCLQLQSNSIMGLEYVPSVEEMETYEQLEAEHEKKDRDKAKKAKTNVFGGPAEAPM
ncbi:zinc finger BED domain-containing protein RICESLEEPER 2-like [Rosa rugosa]|uniref:zinc finger BED domain-containing protein RICESLEEPER 2-like n=1 Tax=Rosa rugosa TaxID=74645 RepID=UPI002B407D2D|nr:zinc finger BED domain-containing protein RICESLEEPER 2-like [Rosa rugosa]